MCFFLGGIDMQNLPDKIFCGIGPVAKYLGCERGTLYRMLKWGEFPKPDQIIPLGGNHKLRIWKNETIEAFQQTTKLRRRGQRRTHKA